ncbi:Nuclear transcription factor Y subunit A-10 like [Actinidia chinensis var. chinensis]|uniref:Nuclear transcription factor Y subunit n=1 Tax=Actinidia chinensis var. chinensis TaxID=1590841 RepID=A0A2R6QVS9_ACTCC|nr:Nuclear transcription factor Y subunit A-10 like [Actinidia chinensis var. chinensis]
MTMHTVYLKEHDGIVQNPTSQLPPAAVPWWSGHGSQSAHTESFGQFKTSFLENPSGGGQNKQVDRGTEQGLEKGNKARFTILQGDCKTSPNMPVQSATSEYQGRFELGFGQPVICAKYPYGDQCYGVFSTYGPQITGRIMLPLNLTTDDGPIYVNAKQYHGIIRRRLSRAKAESVNKALKDRKPYLHLSRHLHAMRRPRGCGGRFLNTKSSKGAKGGNEPEKTGNRHLFQPAESQISEVLQSDSGNLSSPKEANGSRTHLSGSEVTSLFYRGDADRFAFNHLRPSVLSLTDMMNTGQGRAMPSKWIAVADSCCNLKV